MNLFRCLATDWREGGPKSREWGNASPYMVMMGMKLPSFPTKAKGQPVDWELDMFWRWDVQWPFIDSFVVLQRSWCFFKASIAAILWCSIESNLRITRELTWRLTHLRHVSTWWFQVSTHLKNMRKSNNDHLPRVQVEHKKLVGGFNPSEKHASQIESFPPTFGVKIKNHFKPP